MTEAVTEIRHLIGGEHIGAPEIERRNPARPHEVVTMTATGDAALVDRALDAAETAAHGWRSTAAPARGAILMQAGALLTARRETVARDLTREEGKTLAEALAEVDRAATMLTYYGSGGWRLTGEALPSADPSTHLYTRREPLGVVGLITPWNFPIAIPTWKLAPALLAGNAVVMKAAERTPLSVQHLAEVLIAAGLPAGVLNVVHGPGRVIGEAIAGSPRVAAVSFTGSTGVGRRIAQVVGNRLGRVQTEMGGKNAFVVSDHADVRLAAQLVAEAGFGQTGQVCTATSRVIVLDAVHDAFVAALKERASGFQPGDGLERGVGMGPVVDEAQRDSVLEHLARAEAEGASLATGGAYQGNFLEPVIVTGAQPHMAIAREEVFGPVVAVLRVADLDAAINLVNATPYGLVAGIATTDLHEAMTFIDRVDAGVIKVNRRTNGTDVNAPFGGTRDSSNNVFREQGAQATDFYTQVKTVYLGH